jgi:murein DD-endopeptidase MepM/ murein hydrolase activator NlpD
MAKNTVDPTKSSESVKNNQAESADGRTGSAPPPNEDDPQEEPAEEDDNKEIPKILSSRWVIVEKDETGKEKYKAIKEARPEDKVKIELRIRITDEIKGKDIKIKLLDAGDENKEIAMDKPITLTVGDKGSAFYSEDVEINKEWLLKELRVKVAQEAPFEEEFIEKSKMLSVLPFEFAELYIRVIDARSQNAVRYAKVKKIIFDNGDKQITEEFDRNEGRRQYTYSTRAELIQCSMAALGSFTTNGTRKSATKFEELKDKLYKDKVDNKDYLGFFKDYWADRAPGFKIEMKEDEEDKYRLLMKKIVLHYNAHLVSDNDGWLTLFIPKPFLDDKEVSIEIGFFDFPVVLERITGNTTAVIRPHTMVGNKMNLYDNNSRFKIAWKSPSTQETDWGKPFGWEIQDGDIASELKVSEKITIKTDTNKFEKFAPELLSPFHEVHKFHFALFVMEWCQPVWDGIEDPDPEEDGRRSNNDAFVNRRDDQGNWIRGLNMHIVTKVQQYVRTIDPFGHYYGFYEHGLGWHRSGRTYKHGGVDLYGGENNSSNIFAIHGGYVKRAGSANVDTGHYIELFFVKENNSPKVRYLHLANQATVDKQYVLCGQTMGQCGRTGAGFIGENIDNPSHMHFELRSFANTVYELGDINNQNILATADRDSFNLPDVHNVKLFITNKYPLILPCRGHYVTGHDAVRQCQFSNLQNLKYCWAVREFPYTNGLLHNSSNNHTEDEPSDMRPQNQVIRFICPHVFSANNPHREAQLQAKLRFVFENCGLLNIPNNQRFIELRVNDTATSNGIDGSIGPTTNTWIKTIILAYQDELPVDSPNKTTPVTNALVTMFTTRYNADGNTPSNNELVDGAYEWFENFQFE